MDEHNIELIEVNNAVRVIFNLRLNELTNRKYIEHESPSYHFKKPTNDQWRIKFLSVFDGAASSSSGYHYCNQRQQRLVPTISLHINSQNRSQVYVYQVIASVHSCPELGVIGFQSRHVSHSSIQHSRMFSLNQLQHAAAKNGSGMVRVSFEVSCYNERGNQSTVAYQTIDENVALLNLFGFLEEGTHSDVTLKTDGREFKAHKLILSARSPVFATMFQSDYTNVIEVGHPAEIVEEMLRFMYTNRTENLEFMPLDLFAAAHTYEIDGLQRICKDYVCQNINANNVTTVLEFAERYALNQVAVSAMDFVVEHEAEVVQKEDFIGYLVERLKPESVASSLEMTQRHRLVDFREAIVKFIAKNFAVVMRDGEYRELYRTNVDLILDVQSNLRHCPLSGVSDLRHCPPRPHAQ